MEYRWDIGSVASIDAPDAVVDFDSSILDGLVTVTVNLQVEDPTDGQRQHPQRPRPGRDEIDCPAFWMKARFLRSIRIGSRNGRHTHGRVDAGRR